MPSPAVVREGRIREAIAWSRLQGFASSSPSPMAFSRLTDRFVTEYFYTKKSARELAEATLRRLRVEEQKKDLILVPG